MSSLPTSRRSFSASQLTAAGYGVASVLLCAAGWLLAHVPDTSLIAATALLALLAACALILVALRTHTLASPMVLLGVPLLLSLAAAMQPVTRIFSDWSLDNLGAATLIVLAPIVGVAVAMVTLPGGTPPVVRGTDALPHPGRLVAACVAMAVVGTAVYAYEWSAVGGPPLLSATIDETRFALQYGVLHLPTQGVPLAMLIATWARVARPQCFTATQRRILEAVICSVPIVLALGGGRSLVLLPLLSSLVVAGRYLSTRTVRRMLVVIPIAILVFSSAIFLARLSQQTPTGVVGTVLYNDTGARSSVFESTYRTLSINLGEQLRVVAELRDGGVETPPFTTSIWFAHNVFSRAIDPHTITGPNAGGWLTSTYAGQLLLDFGLLAALLFGVLLGAVSHTLYRRFARGRSVTIIWIYAYLAGPIAMAFYLNIFLYFIFPLIDLLVLFALSRLLIATPASSRSEAKGLVLNARPSGS